MGRSLDGTVVVITGGSSGIGRCAALKFARSGSRVALAGREQRALTETVAACRAQDGQVIAVRTDVRQESDVHACAQEAIDTFGQIDVWVNSAGVISYGRFEDVPSEVFRGGDRDQLDGPVHGSRAAIRRFREPGQGTLINLASVWGRVTTPDVSAYVTSKFAVRAFSECLRQELADAPGIHVTTSSPKRLTHRYSLMLPTTPVAGHGPSRPC